MIDKIQAYLTGIVHHSGLTKTEKDDWIEEMSAHLQDNVNHRMNGGQSREEAIEEAISQFGSPAQLRTQIGRELFGSSPRIIWSVAIVSFILFLTEIYVLHMFSLFSLSNRVAQFFTKVIPLSPSLMLALCLNALLLFKTRRRRDRLAIAAITGLFGILWILMRIFPHYGFGSSITFMAFRTPITLLDPTLWVGSILLMLICTIMYIWTCNRWIGLYPIFLSFMEGLWPMIKDTIQYLFWQETHAPSLWGVPYIPFRGVDGIRFIITVIVRILIVLILLKIFQYIKPAENRSKRMKSLE